LERYSAHDAEAQLWITAVGRSPGIQRQQVSVSVKRQVTRLTENFIHHPGSANGKDQANKIQ